MKTKPYQYSLLSCVQIAIDFWESQGMDGMFAIMDELYVVRALARRRIWRGGVSGLHLDRCVSGHGHGRWR